MKTKDLTQLIIAIALFAVVGFVVYNLLTPNKSSKGVSVEVITPLEPSFSTTALADISDSTKVTDFYTPPDLKQGIGNPLPFKPVK